MRYVRALALSGLFLLSGCVEPSEPLYGFDGGIRIALKYHQYFCEGSDHRVNAVKPIEIDERNGKFSYRLDDGRDAVDYQFHPVDTGRYVVAYNRRELSGKLDQGIIFVQFSGSLLVAATLNETTAGPLAARYGVGLQPAKYDSTRLSGPVEAQRSFVEAIARRWDLLKIFYTCVPAVE